MPADLRYYQKRVRARRRLWMLHTAFPTLHKFPELPYPGNKYVRCSCGVTRPAPLEEGCVFCDPDQIASPIDWRTSPDGHSVMVFEPLNPVVIGHRLVVPTVHVPDATADPTLTGEVLAVAAEVAAESPAANLITSIGRAATQTVMHLHAHVVPRHEGDELPLPWTPLV